MCESEVTELEEDGNCDHPRESAGWIQISPNQRGIGRSLLEAESARIHRQHLHHSRGRYLQVGALGISTKI